MSGEMQVSALREPLLAATAVSSALPAPDAEAALAPQALARQMRQESPATPEPDRSLASLVTSRPDLPILVAERSRTPLANRADHEPDLRGKRRKLRVVPRSRWTQTIPDLGLSLDVSA